MEEIKDYIYDAYYFKKGYEFGEKVRRRINWMVNNVKGNRILDVGCSQGITSIILGREGKKVLGIDFSSSAISDAFSNLEKEEKETQEKVVFEKCNFFDEEFNTKFETIILGEILEHVADLDTFFAKAISLIEPNGRIIVTTPFGINDFADHKRTFYINDIISLQQEDLHIKKIEYLGGWVGLIFENSQSNSKPLEVNSELLSKLEDAFLQKERSLVEKLKSSTSYKESPESHSNQKYLDEKIEKVKIQNELNNQYRKEKELLNAYQKLKREHDNLTKNYNKIKNRYDSIRKSKLGRITTKYWDLRRRKG